MSGVKTRSSTAAAAAKATSITTPSKKSTVYAYLAKPGSGPFCCDAVLLCDETGEYLTFKQLTKKHPKLEAMCPAGLSKAERKLYINAWNDTMVKILKGNDAEKRKKLIERARTEKQVHLSRNVEALGDKVAALGDKVEAQDGKIEAQGTEIKAVKAKTVDLAVKFDDLKEFVKKSVQRPTRGSPDAGTGGNGGTTEASADLVPPSTDKKPSADPRPSPRKLFAATGGTGNGAVLKATCTSTPVASAPSVFPSISFADTSPAPLEDLQEWAARRRIASGSQVSATAVTNLIKPYVSDQSINRVLRRGKATEQHKNFANSISIALTAMKPFPFVNCFVYRGIELTHEDAFHFKALMMSREPFVEYGLLSATAKSLDVLKNKTYIQRNTHFAIRSKSGRLIQKYSQREDEWEVLFAAGTSFRILSFEDTTPGVDPGVSGRGRYKIVMEEIKSQIWGL